MDLGYNNKDDTIGTWQPVKYEIIPLYYEYCRHQGHDAEEYKSRMRDEEYRQRKETNNKKKNRNKENMYNNDQENEQAMKTRKRSAVTKSERN